MLIDIEVALPDGKLESGEIDLVASLDEIKKDILEAYKLGPPNEFEMYLRPKSGEHAAEHYRITSGDRLIIVKPPKPKAFQPTKRSSNNPSYQPNSQATSNAPKTTGP